VQAVWVVEVGLRGKTTPRRVAGLVADLVVAGWVVEVGLRGKTLPRRVAGLVADLVVAVEEVELSWRVLSRRVAADSHQSKGQKAKLLVVEALVNGEV
jgi:hypothetical protein